MQKRRPVMLVVLDGWGWRETSADNAVRQARTPAFDRLWAACPHSLLQASGHDVGLPQEQMGNSEVGHLNIGAGRVVKQTLLRIGDAITDGKIKRAPALLGLIERLRQTGGSCHLIGLVSPGGVHSHQDHAATLAQILAKSGVPAVVHAFTDGRDTPPRSASADIARLLAALPQVVPIATVCGRYYGMDRDNRWDRVAKAYHAIAQAEGPRFPDAAAVIADAYAHGISDEFVVPAVVGDYRGVQDGDGVLCFNFRADRVREILAALLDAAFAGFPRRRSVRLAFAVGMTQYGAQLNAMQAIFPPQSLPNVLGQVVADRGRTQLRMAETEKYPHVTYFLNGGTEDQYPGEDRIMVRSPQVATYDLQPEMSAPELTDKAVDALGSGKYDLIVLNYANPDMVGHTGNLAAAIKAVETVDTGLGRIADAIGKTGGALVVTADHGNCEMMRDPETGGPHTSHTTNPVPLLLMGVGDVTLADGRLADVAPTLLELMELPKPVEMTGVSLLRPCAGDEGRWRRARSIMTKEPAALSGEERLIARYFRPLAKHPGAFGLIDDAAVLVPPAGCDLVLKTDGLIGGVHFFPDDPADAVAKKALRVNLSDLAAKGARPLGFLLAIALPQQIGPAWLELFARGLGEDADIFGCPLLGGDTDRTPGPVTISIAAFGAVGHGEMIRRSGAKPGDRVVVTGTIGDAALGLLLRRDATTARRWELDPRQQDHLRTRYLIPEPRTAIAEVLRKYATAAMDVSDGLVGDLAKLCRASGVAAEINIESVPLSDAARSACAKEPALIERILTGGDDYEILATLPAGEVAAFRQLTSAVGVLVTEIGKVTAGEGDARFLDRNRKTLVFAHPSYSHF